MARKYVRDKRGRFASTGATARGARLGGGRARQTMKAGSDLAPKASAPSGTVSGTHRGRVAQRAARIGGVGAYPKAAKSLKRSVANKQGARTKAAAKQSLSARKQALVKKVSSAVLSGKKVSAAQKSYVKAQQSERLRMQGGGKGNAARRRMKK